MSFSTGVILGFVLSRYWVFQNQSPYWRGQFMRFILVIGVMYIINSLLMQGLYWFLPPFIGRSSVVRGLAAVSAFPLSFALHRRISFA